MTHPLAHPVVDVGRERDFLAQLGSGSGVPNLTETGSTPAHTSRS